MTKPDLENDSGSPSGHPPRGSADAAEATVGVQRLRLYPLKAGRGFDVDRMAFDAAGPVHDRRWMAVHPNGHFITQREEPRLATVSARILEDGLSLSAPGQDPIAVKTPSGSGFPVRVWTSAVDAAPADAEADAWLTELFGYPARLAHLPLSSVRPTNPAFAPGGRVTFADGYPALVITAESFAELQHRAEGPLEIERFRPNIIVGPTRPHAEDRWRGMRIGRMDFRGVKLCARCKVTTLDQDTGERHPGNEPLRTLARYRNIEGKLFFGLNVVHAGEGSIKVGDAVTITERGSVPVG
ncbi:MAG: MOSC domain-containing protein [Gemmatimonadota bacterium]|nr:MOSC domain-containing protein [Gemmatimonadota bacterium]